MTAKYTSRRNKMSPTPYYEVTNILTGRVVYGATTMQRASNMAGRLNVGSAVVCPVCEGSGLDTTSDAARRNQCSLSCPKCGGAGVLNARRDETQSIA